MSLLSMLFSGASGGLSSVLGKMALSEKQPFIRATALLVCREVGLSEEIHGLFGENGGVDWFHALAGCRGVELIIQMIVLFVMFYCNAMMVFYFLKALETRGSLPVTVVTSAVNFLVIGLLSNIVLDEKLSIMWCFGAALIMVGVFCIMFSQGSTKEKPHR